MKALRSVIAGLCVLIISFQLASCQSAGRGYSISHDTKKALPPPARKGELTDEEMNLARVAWRYFENNYQPATGMVNAVDQYPSTTMWDTASYLAGLVSVYELGIITGTTFHDRLSKLLQTFQKLSLFQDELPNKAYDTTTAEKVDYANHPGEIGFSAIDLGRLLIWLKIIKGRYPAYAPEINRFVDRWNFEHVLDRHGTMYGAKIDANGQVQYLQEGRLGYEEYAAKGFQLWSHDTRLASMLEPYDFVEIYGIEIPFDTRDPRKFGAHNYVVSESFILDGIEFNWDNVSYRGSTETKPIEPLMAQFAERIYKVQEARYRYTGLFTARTEHQLDGPPYFVYDTIYCDGYPWNTITEDGRYVPQFAAVATKGALGLWVLWRTPYTDQLYRLVKSLYEPDKGFYEGQFEKSKKFINAFTANNNGIILETLLFKVQGELLKSGNRS